MLSAVKAEPANPAPAGLSVNDGSADALAQSAAKANATALRFSNGLGDAVKESVMVCSRMSGVDRTDSCKRFHEPAPSPRISVRCAEWRTDHVTETRQ